MFIYSRYRPTSQLLAFSILLHFLLRYIGEKAEIRNVGKEFCYFKNKVINEFVEKSKERGDKMKERDREKERKV